MTYLLNHVEAFSQWLNVFHGGNPNVTFSARCGQIRDGSSEYWILPKWYWSTWILAFETLWPGHLDWALGSDE